MTTLLIVEDELLIANSMKNRLENLGYRVAGIAVSGESAIQKTKLIQPDLVLMDIKLHGRMDGVAAAETIRIVHHASQADSCH